MAADRPTGLQIIFSFFLGLMVVAFIGVGVYTFYPSPQKTYADRLQKLYRQQEDIQGLQDGVVKSAPTTLTASQEAELKKIRDQIRALEDKQQAESETWGRNTSIILITFATFVMSISLIRADQLPVISNGLLLGGVFTMVYGVGWIVATGTSYARFGVMTAALLITLALGYVRFVRGRTKVPAAASAGAVDAAEVTDLESRVARLEHKLATIAETLKSSD